MTHALLLSFSRTCFCVVKAGGILVPDPATLHSGRHCNCACMAKTHACMFIHTRMHANSDMKTVTRMHGLLVHDGEIRFTSMNIVFERS